MKARHRIAHATVSAAATLLLAGCGLIGSETPSTEKTKGPTMNMQDAADRADAILDATFKAIKPGVQWTHGETTTGSCDLSRRRAVMTVISEQRRGNFLGLIQRHWEGEGFEITAVNKDKDLPAIYAESSDGFTLRMSIGGKGQAFFEVATPCVKESAVSDPTTPSNGPNYAGGPIPRPDVTSDFWSSDSPAPAKS